MKPESVKNRNQPNPFQELADREPEKKAQKEPKAELSKRMFHEANRDRWLGGGVLSCAIGAGIACAKPAWGYRALIANIAFIALAVFENIRENKLAHREPASNSVNPVKRGTAKSISIIDLFKLKAWNALTNFKYDE